MDDSLGAIIPLLARLDTLLSAVAPASSSARRAASDRWRSDSVALRFHLGPAGAPRSHAGGIELLTLIGGTGTGKSTLVNRLVGRLVSAASFRRTFTSGPVAIVPHSLKMPIGWLDVEHVEAPASDLPARGRPGALLIVHAEPAPGDQPRLPILVDTPDLDGDQPAHHAQADRAFRWGQAVLFLVTPEKYQMTELLPYYRVARRYAVPTLFVMNKCEEQAVVMDYRRQLNGMLRQVEESPPEEARVFALARDGAGYEPGSDEGLDALKKALASLPAPPVSQALSGLKCRASDLLGRLMDQVVAPLRNDRLGADELISTLRAMETPVAGVDVNPLTRQLHRRLQQRSILYLMGPGRVLDRVRQAPMILARLPRFAWDYLKNGEVSPELLSPPGPEGAQTVPDFKAALADQFAVLQSRIDDCLRSSPTGESWIADPAKPYAEARIDPAEAGRIAEQELAELSGWLEKKWNATPRDTRAIESLLRYLPGGRSLGRWTEAAPYLLTIVLIVAHHAITGGADLMVVGGYTLATWLTERLSNEVTSRTRAANARIEARFAELAHDQISRVCRWLDGHAPTANLVEQIDAAAEQFSTILSS